MQVQITDRRVIVTREPGAPRIGRESTFWHHLQRALNEGEPQNARRWYRVRPHKFALTSMPFALRQGPNRKRNESIIDGDYMLRAAHTAYNAGQVQLQAFILEDV